MKWLILLSLISCGDYRGRNVCISRDAKVLECRAVEAARYTYNSPAMLESQKQKCERQYTVLQCYPE